MEEKPGKNGYLLTKQEDSENENSITVEIPNEMIQSFIIWLFVMRFTVFDTSVKLKQSSNGSMQYFKITFLSADSLKNKEFHEFFAEFCENNDLNMVNMENELKEAEKILGKK